MKLFSKYGPCEGAKHESIAWHTVYCTMTEAQYKYGWQMGDDPSDDGANCWDCGKSEEEHALAFPMCTTCGHSICDDCQRAHSGSSRCGSTTPVLG